MLNPFKDVNWNPDRAERRKFARSLMIGFPIITVVFTAAALLKTHTLKPFPFWLGGIGLALGVVLWLLPQIAKPFYVVWYFLGCCMGIVMGNVLLSAFYFLMLTPLGLLMRVTGRDLLRKKFNRQTPTYWQDAEKVVDLKRYYRQF
jgi:hypothetical protein